VTNHIVRDNTSIEGDGLTHEGILIFTSGGVDEPVDGSNPFLGHPLYHAALGIPKLLEIISKNGCICRHLEYDQKHAGEEHLYLIVQKVDQGGVINSESLRSST